MGVQHDLQPASLRSRYSRLRCVLDERYMGDLGMRITLSLKSKGDLPAAISALNHFIKEKKPGDGTADSWGIGITGGTYFSVSVKKNGNYSVKQSE